MFVSVPVSQELGDEAAYFLHLSSDRHKAAGEREGSKRSLNETICTNFILPIDYFKYELGI